MNEPEADQFGGIRWAITVAVRDGTVAHGTLPPSAAHHAIRALCGSLGILYGVFEVPIEVPVPAPLPSVSRHVVKAVAVGQVTQHGLCSAGLAFKIRISAS